MAISSQDIQNFLLANPGMTDAQIASAMQQYNVSPAQVASATNLPMADVQSRFDTAIRQDLNQQITSRVSELLASGGNEFDIAREANKAGLSARDLSLALNIPEQEITKLSGGVLNGIPARPTFSGVAAEFNVNHMARFGTPLNLARAASEDVQRQVAELQAETLRKQTEWDKLYGNTPEGKIIKENPPPDWRQFYEPWSQSHVDRFGKIIDRPWSTDEATINEKRNIDQQYVNAVSEYNKKYGTNIAPDPSVLGTFSQPSEFAKQVDSKKWYENPLNVAGALGLLYFGGSYLSGLLGGGGASAAGATGGAAGTAGTAGSALVPSAFDAAVTSALGGGSTLGSGGALGTAGFGSALPTAAEVASGLTAAGFAPGTAANLAGQTAAGIGATNLLGGATAAAPLTVSPGISPTDALRAANTLRQLTAQPEQQRSAEQQAAQMAAGAVDYSGLLNLLASRANTSGLLGTQFQPQSINLASLLG
jgi:hypothetical protein